MAARFRLATSYQNHTDNTTRPPLPQWLHPDNQDYATRNQEHSYNHWSKVYWATPPWINDEQIELMEFIYLTAEEGEHVDHIVPLKSELVCGLHVPWNLQIMGAKENLQKSNKYWPDCPIQQLTLEL